MSNFASQTEAKYCNSRRPEEQGYCPTKEDDVRLVKFIQKKILQSVVTAKVKKNIDLNGINFSIFDLSQHFKSTDGICTKKAKNCVFLLNHPILQFMFY